MPQMGHPLIACHFGLPRALQVTELQPKLVDGYYHKGFSLYHLRDYQGAVSALGRLTVMQPEYRYREGQSAAAGARAEPFRNGDVAAGGRSSNERTTNLACRALTHACCRCRCGRVRYQSASCCLLLALSFPYRHLSCCVVSAMRYAAAYRHLHRARPAGARVQGGSGHLPLG